MTAVRLLPPGSTLGILGGGQLGRMLAQAAAELGFKAHIYAPPGDNPATEVAAAATIAGWDDIAALDAFARSVDVVTYEFENVPVETAERLDNARHVRPGVNALAIAQDRLAEKTMATSLALEVAPFAAIDSASDIAAALAEITAPAILKTRRLGYDGKGQAAIVTDKDATAAWDAIGGQPAVLEQRIPFDREISAIVARGADDTVAAFDIAENRHEDGILRTSTVPASVGPEIADQAVGIATAIARHLDYVGVLAVELFVLGAGATARLLVNEIAPRVHNSGHWTMDGCVFSQFELHVRAVMGWPLPPDPLRHSDVEMANLIGSDVDAWQELVAEPQAKVHVYGKAEARPGRKMGHVNRVTPRHR